VTEYPLGRLAGLSVSARPSALIAFAATWLLGACAAFALGQPLLAALGAGLGVVVLHWLSEFVHQLGHAWAAQRTGHPMLGVRFWGLLSSSLYPPDEPALPGRVHVRRALGGPALSTVVVLGCGIIVQALAPAGGVALGLAWFAFLDNLLVFALGSFLPLGFTDGSALLHWWGKS
jgi:hypothetical protein